MFRRMGFKHKEEMQHCFYVAALTQFARFQARGHEKLDPEVSWRGTSWDEIERFLNDMRTSFAAHSLSKLERAVIPPLRDGNGYKLDPVVYTAPLGYDIVLDQIRLLCSLYMQHTMENKLPYKVANAVPDCMQLSSKEMKVNESYKHDAPLDISNAGNMKDLFCLFMLSRIQRILEIKMLTTKRLATEKTYMMSRTRRSLLSSGVTCRSKSKLTG